MDNRNMFDFISKVNNQMNIYWILYKKLIIQSVDRKKRVALFFLEYAQVYSIHNFEAFVFDRSLKLIEWYPMSMNGNKIEIITCLL